MRRTVVLLIAATVVLLAGFTPPTTAGPSDRLTSVADYLHQVIAASPHLDGELGARVTAVDAATSDATCRSLVPRLQRLRPPAERAIDDPRSGDATVKELGQLLGYGDEVLAACAPAPG